MFTPFLGVAVPITPDKDITVVNKQAEDPLWKQLWDEARSLTQQEKYSEAIEKYQAILKDKPNIEEAKWELCKAYMTLEEYEKASVVLESLLETDSNRIEYLISAGKIALLEERVDQAIEYYGQALETQPGGQFGDEALAGLAGALIAGGKNRAAIPLMEQLYHRSAIDPGMLNDLAEITWDEGFQDKAAHYYTELITKYRVDPHVIREAADINEKLGRIEAAAIYWQRYLEEIPDFLLFHQKLAEYLIANGQNEQSLYHIDILLENNIDRERYLLIGAESYLYDTGRVDKALNYYQEYMREFPDGRDVSQEIAHLQLLLANDLLSIVENTGVWMLWRDLALVTPGRIDIYRVMADMLDQLGKQDELIEMLQIILVHVPDDTDTRVRLARLYKARGNMESCLLFLDSEHVRDPIPAEFYSLRASCEEKIGQEIPALADLVTYLEKNPEDEIKRTKGVQIAASLGLTGIMQSLYTSQPSRNEADNPKIYILDEKYLSGLLQNQLFTEAETIIDELARKRSVGQEGYRELEIQRAEIYFAQGKLFEAGRVLRQLVAAEGTGIEPFLLLSRLGIAQQDSEAAKNWRDLAHDEVDSRDSTELLAMQSSRLFYHDLLLMELQGRKKQAVEKGIEYLHAKNIVREFVDQDVDILVFIAAHYLHDQKYSDALELLKYYKKIFRSESVIDQLTQIAELKLEQESGPADLSAKPGTLSEPRLSDLLTRAEIVLEIGLLADVKSLVKPVLKELPESTRALTLIAQGDMKDLGYDPALRQYEQLVSMFPNEAYFHEQVRRIQYLQGNNETIIGLYDNKGGTSSKTQPLDYSGRTLDELIDILFYARALWAENRWDEALEIYDDIYMELNKRISDSMIALKTTPEYKTFNPLSFWEDLLYSPEDEEYLNVLLSPFHFSQIRGTEAGRISAGIYDTFRWHEIVKLEKDAKSALNAKEFYQAEKDYQELIEADTIAAEEVYPDLATVLSRLGKRKEEAELLEKIKELNLDYPVLKEAAAKDLRQRKPHLSVEAKYREEEGRQGYKNITQKYAGGEISLTPTASQEAGVWFARNEYGDNISSTLMKSFYIIGKHAMKLNDYIDTTASLGFEDFDTDGKSFLIFDFAAHSTFEGGVGLHAALKQAPVDDTIAALAEGIYRRDFKAGLTIDYLPSLFLGFDFSALNYSDENDGNEFNIWGSYKFFTERSSVDITYDYQKIENKIANSANYSRSTQNVDEELSYWSPGSYWKHLLSAEYKLELWQTGRLQSGTSYVSGRYGIGYEKGDNVLQELEMNILLEINKIFLLKGTFGSEWSSDYENQEAFISLSYRW